LTVATAIKEPVRARCEDYPVRDVTGAMNEELPPLETLWRILQTRTRAAIRKEIANRCGLSAPASRSYPALLVNEEHLSVSGAGEFIDSEETYGTTERGLQITDVLAPIRGGRR